MVFHAPAGPLRCPGLPRVQGRIGVGDDGVTAGGFDEEKDPPCWPPLSTGGEDVSTVGLSEKNPSWHPLVQGGSMCQRWGSLPRDGRRRNETSKNVLARQDFSFRHRGLAVGRDFAIVLLSVAGRNSLRPEPRRIDSTNLREKKEGKTCPPLRSASATTARFLSKVP